MTALSPKKPARKYTYSDYLTWGEEVGRCELIDGKIYAMASPSSRHQEISGNFHGLIWNFLRGKRCKVFHAAFDVRLNPNEDDTVVQPDIVVICDPSKIEKNSCKGAPDFIIEIESPSTAKKDRFIKLEKYAQAGVKEYWIAQPDEHAIQIFRLDETGVYKTHCRHEADSTVQSSVLEGLEIKLTDIFGPPPEEPEIIIIEEGEEENGQS